MKPKPRRPTPRAALALCLVCAACALLARAQAPAPQEGAPRKLTPRVVASVTGYEGPSGLRGRPALVAFSPDGRLLALSGEKFTVNLHDAATGRLLHTLSTARDAGLDAFSFSPDGRTAATRDREDKTVRLWDLATGKEVRALAGRKRDIETKWKASSFPTNEFIPVPFGPEGRTVLVEREDDLVTVFEAEAGRELAVLDHKTESSSAKAVLMMAFGGKFRWLRMRPAFSPDGRLVVTANGDKFPKLWDAATGRLIATLGDHRDVVYNADFSPDSRLVATETSEGVVHLWDAATGQFRAKLKPAKIDYSYFNQSDLYFTPSFVFGPDSRALVTYHDRVTQIWDAETGALRNKLKDSEGDAVAFSPDGRLLLTASDAGVRLWDAATGEPAATLPRSRFPARFSPDGRRLATGGNEKTAYLYELE